MLNRRNIIIIFVGLIVLAVIGVAIHLIFTGSGAVSINTDLPPEQNGLPVVPVNQSNVPSSPTIMLGTATGIVTVNNFYKIALGIDASTVLLVNDPNYQITYDTIKSSFSITLTPAAAAGSESNAETKLLQILGISQAQACQLSVTPTLSFCPSTPNVFQNQ